MDRYSAADVWYYINEYNEVRYDIPKYRLQQLEMKARQYQELDTLYNQAIIISNQLRNANLVLQREINEIRIELSDIEQTHRKSVKNFNKLKKDYDAQLLLNQQYRTNINNNNIEISKLKTQRNYLFGSAIAVIVVGTLIILN